MSFEEPRKQSAAGCIILDGADRIMIVEPAYKSTWEIPGGQIEAGESPRDACQREVMEELGLKVIIGELLAVDCESSRDTYRFIFDGGVLTPRETERITLDSSELLSYRFAALDEASELLNDRLARRVVAIVKDGAGPYLEHGLDPYQRP